MYYLERNLFMVSDLKKSLKNIIKYNYLTDTQFKTNDMRKKGGEYWVWN